MVRALQAGLRLTDFEDMTVGMILDYIIEYNSLNSNSDNEESAESTAAVQKDFDMF